MNDLMKAAVTGARTGDWSGLGPAMMKDARERAENIQAARVARDLDEAIRPFTGATMPMAGRERLVTDLQR